MTTKPNDDNDLISLSVISHEQNHLVESLFSSIQKHIRSNVEVILTINTLSDNEIDTTAYNFPIKVIYNHFQKGFGNNHNSAFSVSRGKYFLVLNPDIEFTNDPFIKLLPYLDKMSVGVVAPKIVDPNYDTQDSCRKYPTPLRILSRIFSKRLSRKEDYILYDSPIEPDWVAGMFMLFKKDVFNSLNGFDQDYFMYCEDADICRRAKKFGLQTILVPGVKVIHNARRESHKKLKFLKWHIESLLRFFFIHKMWFKV